MLHEVIFNFVFRLAKSTTNFRVFWSYWSTLMPIQTFVEFKRYSLTAPYFFWAIWSLCYFFAARCSIALLQFSLRHPRLALDQPPPSLEKQPRLVFLVLLCSRHKHSIIASSKFFQALPATYEYLIFEGKPNLRKYGPYLMWVVLQLNAKFWDTN